MTEQILRKELDDGLPTGVTYSFNPPCDKNKFSTEQLDKIFKSDLPIYLKGLRKEFDKIPMGMISGLAPIGQSGPIDECVINGEWCPKQQALHGGQIPITGAMPGSKRLAEEWNLN